MPPLDDDEIQVLQHGTIQKGYTYCTERTWKRADVYIRRDDGEEFGEPAFCDGSEDRSDRAIDYNGPDRNITYNAACASCYLGFTHTVALHQRRTQSEEHTLKETPAPYCLPMLSVWAQSTLVYYFPTWHQLEIHVFDVPREIFNAVPAADPIDQKVNDPQFNTWSRRISTPDNLRIYLYTHEPPQEVQP